MGWSAHLPLVRVGGVTLLIKIHFIIHAFTRIFEKKMVNFIRVFLSK